MDKTITLLEATEFARENGYHYAVYELKDDNYYKIEEAIFNTPIDDNTTIIVETIGNGIDFKEFITVDKKYCFRMHNNFNTPDIIPVFNKFPANKL